MSSILALFSGLCVIFFIDTTQDETTVAQIRRAGTVVKRFKTAREKTIDSILLAYTKLVRHGISSRDSILVVTGPGMFSAVRNGVVVANTMVAVSGAKLIAVDRCTLDRALRKTFSPSKGYSKAELRILWRIVHSLSPSAYQKRGMAVPFYEKEPSITRQQQARGALG